MRTVVLLGLFMCLSLRAGEAARPFPLWDGKEAVADYAARVNLPPTKTLPLGGGVSLELVLIPAGQFMMGSEEPKKPAVDIVEASWIIILGSGATSIWFIIFLISYIRNRKFSFSLLSLVMFTICIGAVTGGTVRLRLARTEATRYATELAAFNALPANEKPAHSVTLTQPFYMGKYTVTQAQYAAVVGNNPSHFKGANLPVETVSWDEATAFCAKLSGLLNDPALQVSLPTEAQWEFACRAGTRTRFYSGDLDSDLDAEGWYAANSGGTTHPVGQKKANNFGLYDMHGNVWQWCQDTYNENYSTAPTTDPINNDKGAARVLRGGSWGNDPGYCRSANRGRVDPDGRYGSLGFRVALVSSSRTP